MANIFLYISTLKYLWKLVLSSIDVTNLSLTFSFQSFKKDKAVVLLFDV